MELFPTIKLLLGSNEINNIKGPAQSVRATPSLPSTRTFQLTAGLSADLGYSHP